VTREDHELEHKIRRGIANYETNEARLPGLSPGGARDSLVRQIVDSDRRRRYARHITSRELSPSSADPRARTFNPLKAAVIFQRRGDMNEAFWMLFLFVHFGRHKVARYAYAAQVYGRLAQGGLWNWRSVSEDVSGFREWLAANRSTIEASGAGFGNHRKYESLDAWSPSGTGACVASYVAWTGERHDHTTRLREVECLASGDPAAAFHLMYRGMQPIQRFGRTARFDYLSMAGKLDLANMQPGSPYLRGSTGPLRGAELLFDGRISGSGSAAGRLDLAAQKLAESLGVECDVIEDALCNWQKSPNAFRPFRG
jgi:hypothetical protein